MWEYLLTVVFVSLAAMPLTAAEPPDRVKALFEEMQSGKYGKVLFPTLTWDDVPALLERVDSTTALKSWPINPVSSMAQKQCSEGAAALWLIEGLRQGGKFASLNPVVTGPQVRGAEGDRQAAKAYRAWWAKVKDLPAEKARKVDPLAGTGLRWY